MPNDKSKIEDLKRSLYSNEGKIFDVSRRHRLRTESVEAPKSWEGSDLPITESLESKKVDLSNLETNNYLMTKEKKSLSFAFKFLMLALTFFILAVGVLGYKFYYNSNVVSANNVDIIISGSTSIAAGEELTYTVDIKNNNSVSLNQLSYLVEYPDGTRVPNDLTKELVREGKSGQSINSGNTLTFNPKAVLFGAEGEKKELKISVEYRVTGSNAVFHKEKIYGVEISSAPVSVTVNGLKEATSGQTISFSVDIRSDSRKVIQGLLLKTTFPFGFSLTKSEPSLGTNLWSVGDLAPGASRRLNFVGVIDAQDGEERVFKFTTGLKNPKDSMSIGTPFFTSNISVAIQKPFLGVKLTLDGVESNLYAARPGKTIRAEAIYQNNLPSTISNAEIVVKILGSSINRSTINAESGYYSSYDDTIIFSRENLPELASLAPGETGRLGFTFSTYPSASLGSNNSAATLEISAKGQRGEGASVPQVVLYSSVAKIILLTEVKLSTVGSYTSGPFVNTGPVPPRANQTTTYTVTWSLVNTINDLSGVTVRGTLPSYVKWLNNISPTDDSMTYDPVTGEVVWNAGEVKGGTGKGVTPRSVSFQVSFLASLSHVGKTALIMTESSVTGTDKLSNTGVSGSTREITTSLNGEPGFDSSKGNVIE